MKLQYNRDSPAEMVIKPSFIFILLLILTYAINYPLFLTFRITDIILVLFIFWGLLNYNLKGTSLLALISIFFVLYLLSILYGVLFVGIITPENFIFFYKYNMLFFSIWLISSAKLDEKQIIFLLKILFFSYIILVFNVFLYIYLFDKGIYTQYRPIFPFSKLEGHIAGDAHLYAAYISTGLVAFITFKRYKILKINQLFFLIILIASVMAMTLTGSKNWIATLSVTFLFFSLFELLKKTSILKFKKNILIYFFYLISISFVLFFYLNKNLEGDQSNLMSTVNSLWDRAFSFNIEDKSILDRIGKTKYAIETVFEGPVLIGIGLQSIDETWFDSAIATILISAGSLGLLIFIMIIALYIYNIYKEAIKNQREREFYALFFVTLNYLLINFITEFFLITRSVIPFTIFLALTSKLIKIKKRANL